MILYHATPKANLPNILANGLQPEHSLGRIKGVWMHTASKSAWAILHTMKRHRTQDIVVLQASIPRRHLTRRRRGIWTCAEHITQFDDIIEADDFTLCEKG